MQILIPAAGSSARMKGADKLALPIDGVALLRRSVLRAQATGAAVTVTLRPADPRRDLIADLVPKLGIDLREVPDAAEGLSASLRQGARGTGALMILPADMPDLTTEDLLALIARHGQAPGRILRATAEDGTPGHPVIFPADLRPAFAALAGDAGARAILRDHPDRLDLVPLPGQHALTDLDTPEAWAAWLAAQG